MKKTPYILFIYCVIGLSPAHAQPGAGLMANFSQKVQLCTQLFEQIRDSECGLEVLRFLDGGNISLGATNGTFNVDLKQQQTGVALMGGQNSWAPHYAINTRHHFFDGSNFGYDFSFTFEQNAATTQRISRYAVENQYDLGTYAIGNIIATQANVFYAVGARDHSPDHHFIAAIGIGLGYANVRGNTYLTENPVNTTCYGNASALHAGDSSAAALVKQNCALVYYDRWGVGASARVMLSYQFYAYLAKLEFAVVNLGANSKLVGGESDYDLSPSVFSFTLAYLFQVF